MNNPEASTDMEYQETSCEMNYPNASINLPKIELRPATMADRQALEEMKELSISTLLDPLMTPEQQREMRRITPFDPALIADGTYYVALVDDRIAASGGWSCRAALYGEGEEGSSRAPILDPKRDAAGIRAMYTHPQHTRRGLGSLVLSTSLCAARLAGFRRAQLLATLAGECLYLALGWQRQERVMVGSGGQPIVPGIRMTRDLTSEFTDTGRKKRHDEAQLALIEMGKDRTPWKRCRYRRRREHQRRKS